MRRIPYGKQDITEDDVEAVVRALRSESITQGEMVPEFERQFSTMLGVRYAVAVNSGTAALHLACMVLGVKSEDTVITSPITFVASINCARYCGANPEFIDIDPGNYCLSLDALQKRLESGERAIQGVIVVHFAGFPVDMRRLAELSTAYQFWVIEDACHAPGGYRFYGGELGYRCGDCSYADAAAFSFHPVKHMTTGEGGMFVTNNTDLYQQALRLRTHGITREANQLKEYHGGWYYEMQELGFNYRMTDFQAALGLSQLQRLAGGNLRRQEIANRYNEAFAGLPLVLPPPSSADIVHAHHLYVVQTPMRDTLYAHLHRKGILAQVHYIPVNAMPYYRQLGFFPEETPEAFSYYQRCLSLPIYPSLTDEEIGYVVEVVNEFFTEH